MSLFDSAWAQLGAVGLLGVIVVFIALGRLVPRPSVKTLLDQAELRVAQAEREADRWRAAAEASDQRADILAGQLGEVLAVMRAVESLVRPRRDTTT